MSRERFEKWAEQSSWLTLKRYESTGHYIDDEAQNLWECWQAALSSQEGAGEAVDKDSYMVSARSAEVSSILHTLQDQRSQRGYSGHYKVINEDQADDLCRHWFDTLNPALAAAPPDLVGALEKVPSDELYSIIAGTYQQFATDVPDDFALRQVVAALLKRSQ
jgi:hypothetical protein